MTTRRRSTLDTDQRSSRTSSCGSQPAHISLTLPVENDSPALPTTPDRHKMSGPGNKMVWSRSSLPLDTGTYISDVRWRLVHNCTPPAPPGYLILPGPSSPPVQGAPGSGADFALRYLVMKSLTLGSSAPVAFSCTPQADATTGEASSL